MISLVADSGVNLPVAGVMGLIAYGAIFWIALAFFVLRDARRRSSSALFITFAEFLGFVPPFLGALIYFVIRPPRTLEEDRSLALEYQALVEPAYEEPPTRPCPSCGREVEHDFMLCPHCRTQFARRCATCQRTLRLGWTVCPYCAEDVGVHPLNRSPRVAS